MNKDQLYLKKSRLEDCMRNLVGTVNARTKLGEQPRFTKFEENCFRRWDRKIKKLQACISGF